jgi:hypothetical protein
MRSAKRSAGYPALTIGLLRLKFELSIEIAMQGFDAVAFRRSRNNHDSALI